MWVQTKTWSVFTCAEHSKDSRSDTTKTKYRSQAERAAIAFIQEVLHLGRQVQVLLPSFTKHTHTHTPKKLQNSEMQKQCACIDSMYSLLPPESDRWST